ncbi:diacylglycerol kinase [Vibrio sp. JPW-9-11-11]|uniref:diacylglycerol kinase n=1 Tax=Vibrio sp. JPW-9-11-11 TaxID=1416532 RepID=UPI0015942854|nr:diacylglycerol kinase [Vibrio sp. JPW-9-11-11]NVD08152.1 diacylglycerol kinase [Vibrio sp. JPW-9-11-11]
MQTKSTHGVKRLKNALRYSLQGLSAAFKNEPAFKEEVWLATILIPLAVLLAENSSQRIALIGSVVLVLVVELVNSAIEAAVDRMGTEYHAYAKRAKDMASAAVMVSMLLAGYVWLEVLFLS